MQGSRCGAGRLLVVDDDWDLVDVIDALLGDCGISVETASNGAEALQKLQRARPDAILLDLVMPVMDGASFLRTCRADPSYADLPVAVMSASVEAEAVVLELGAQVCLAKPFRMHELLAVVQQLGLAVHERPGPGAVVAPASGTRR